MEQVKRVMEMGQGYGLDVRGSEGQAMEYGKNAK